MEGSQGRNEPRLLGIGDLDACIALDRSALDGLWTPQQWARELSDDKRIALGIKHDDKHLIALAAGWLVADELQITVVAVDPGRRRQGLGFRITKTLIQWGWRAGAVEASLDVSSNNESAIALYASLGFRTTGSRSNYYRDGSDALLQWLKIEPGRDIHTEETDNSKLFGID